MKYKINKSETEWQNILSESEYKILRQEGTERAFTNMLCNENRDGNYYCKGCNSKLFSSKMKFDLRLIAIQYLPVKDRNGTFVSGAIVPT